MALNIRIGTRGSKLAMVQTDYVNELLKKEIKNQDTKIQGNNDDITTEIIKIKTVGDKDQNKKLADLGIGVFTKEIDKSMLLNETDIAVHSLKDVPTLWSDELIIRSVPPRESHNDLLIWKKDRELNVFQDDIIVGTSSIRRAAFLEVRYPNLKVKLLRGNVQTRMKKLEEEEYDAIIMAEAGLNRLNVSLENYNYEVLDMLPAPAQGAIGIATRKADKEINEIVKLLDDKKTHIEVLAERSALKEYGGGCQAPFGALAVYDTEENVLSLTCDLVFEAKGKKVLVSKESFVYCDVDDFEKGMDLGKSLGKLLKDNENEILGIRPSQ
ncbi:hydroxymethylbilane synthase [Methanococcus voltae]|uniref:Probable porphobilinogen deaminase n=2 Tax=Methanococcus voltae TaxID=2188 RepID=A0A8J7UR87_METVO|nr:hydroxymethylbilane synthase [Methanococcus voltae]MBP2201538.1 hydroxymethylbilane synthase [Methanococcus voltae]MCS3922327.1 hydroxymethylbilane synthase [Methanococcus voltae PS]